MKKLRRVARALVKTFPTVCMLEAELTLEGYRRIRDAGGRDWEGERKIAQRLISVAVRDRHLR